MRNWLSAFRPASFRGMPFHVEFEGAEGGRRLAVSPIAYSEDHVDEDMGALPRVHSIVAYVAGDFSDVQAIAFTAVLQAPGPGTLILPMLGGALVRVERWRLARELTRAGYVGFEIDFIASGLSAPGFARVPGAPQLAALAFAAISIVAAAVSARLDSVPPGRGARHATAASNAAETIKGLSLSTGLNAEKSAEIVDAARSIERDAGNPTGRAREIAGSIMRAMSVIGGDGEPDATAAALKQTVADQAGTTPFDLALRCGAACGFCLALARRDYAARQDARAARDEIAGVVDGVLTDIEAGLDIASYAWLGEVAALAAQDLSDTAADRAPLVRVETGASLPAAALAYALYGDTDRAEELVRRNRVSSPAIMPVSFECIAPGRS